jgi:3-oxoacyl-[acyl-carrier protein] reductase
MPAERGRGRILITGVSGEIGAHLAGYFDAAGWQVFGVDRDAPARPLPARLVFVQCDLADGGAAAAALDELARAHGACDVVVNCAGLIANAPVVSLVDGAWTAHDFPLWERVIASSLTTTFHATALSVKHMLAARVKGVIVNVSSVCAKGSAGQAAYSAAKAGVEGLTRAVAKELGPLGIRVVALALGYFDTASMHANVPDSRLAKVVGAVPLRRLGTLPEVADAVDFVIRNQYANGTVIEVNGGLVL